MFTCTYWSISNWIQVMSNSEMLNSEFSIFRWSRSRVVLAHCFSKDLWDFLKRPYLKNMVIKKIGKRCDEGTQREQLDRGSAEKRAKRSNICPCRLLHFAETWICAQLHVNWNNSGIFIFICHGNGLIGMPSFFVFVFFGWNKGKNQNIYCMCMQTYWATAAGWKLAKRRKNENGNKNERQQT